MNTQTPDVTGDWISAVIKMAPKGNHTLHLDPNANFNERYEEPGQATHTASGTYKITVEDVPSEVGSKMQKTGVVNLYYKTLDGKLASQEVQRYPRRYVCAVEAGAPILTDVLEEILTRPAMRDKVRAAIRASAPKPAKGYELSPAEKSVQARWRQVWKFNSPAKPFLDSGLTILPSSKNIVFDHPNGRTILDQNGHPILNDKVPPCAEIFPIRSPAGHLIGEYNTWDQSVRVRDAAGKLLWEFSDSSGVDCACEVSMGDHDAVAISYNGGGGAALVDHGKVVWRVSGLGNAWGIGQLRWSKSGLAGVVIAEDSVRFVRPNGKIAQTIDEETGAVLGADLDGDGVDEALTLGTTVSSGQRLSAFNLDGKRLWTIKSKGEALKLHKPILFGRFLSNSPCVAVVDTAGLVQFFSVSGKPIGVFQVPAGDCEGIVVLPNRQGQDDLIVRTSNGILRYAYQAK